MDEPRGVALSSKGRFSQWHTARNKHQTVAARSLEGLPEHPTIMIAFSLACLLILTFLETAVVASSKPWNCQFTLDNYHFNLCPLLGERHNSGQVDLVLHYETPPTITTIVYNISLNGPLQKSEAIPDDEQVSLASANWGVQSIQIRHTVR